MNDVSGCYLSKFNPYRYRGYRYDEETSLYYLNSRYYNPETGRFLCADGYIGSTGQLLSTNMYTYALNNPITYFDPTGYISVMAEIAIGIAIDIGLTVAINALTAGAAAAFDFLVDILSELVSTIVINLLNKVEWCLNIGENILTSILMGGAIAVVGGFLVKFVVKRLNLGGLIDNVLKKIFKKTDDVLDHADDVASTIAKHSDVSSPVTKQIDDISDSIGNLKPKAKAKPESWSTIRQKYWTEQATTPSSKWYGNDRALMGKAPIGPDGFSIELHHPKGRAGDNIYNFVEMTRTDHIRFHKTYGYHWNGSNWF